MISNFSGKTVLITGGTGSLGRKLISALITRNAKKIIVYSRDERKQVDLRRELNERLKPKVRYFLGDVRDIDRLKRAFSGVDYIIHTAALKHVDMAEYNPFECVKTNIIGAENVVNAAIDSGIKRVLAISSDKAVNPINLYGCSKLVSDKLFLSAHAYAGLANTKFSVIRFGNFFGSRGSVIEFWRRLHSTGVRKLPITSTAMTRFWIKPEEAAVNCLSALQVMNGREIFFPKMEASFLTTMMAKHFPDCDAQIVGIRPGEKLYEEITYEHHRPRIEWREDIQSYVTHHKKFKYPADVKISSEVD